MIIKPFAVALAGVGAKLQGRQLGTDWNELAVNQVTYNQVSFNALPWNGVTFNSVDWNGVAFNQVGWNGVNFNDIKWNGSQWNGVGFNHIDWNQLDWNQIDWNHIDFNGLDFNEIDWNGLSWNTINWNLIDWNQIEWNMIDWNEIFNGINFNKVTYNDIPWNSVHWNRFDWNEFDWNMIKINGEVWNQTQWNQINWNELLNSLGLDWNALISNFVNAEGAVLSTLDMNDIAESLGLTQAIESIIAKQNLIDFDIDGVEFLLHPKFLNPAGVGDLTKVPNVHNAKGGPCQPGDTCILDNRHIAPELKERLCDPAPVEISPVMVEQGADSTAGGVMRYYLDALLYLAWPDNAKLKICCSASAGSDAVDKPCDVPTYTLPEESGTLAVAPHFLTPLFEERQQEALTAAFVAKINTHGIRLAMDLAGRFDLGPAGTKFVTRDDPDNFHYELGQSWGNMFLDCSGKDEEHQMCRASMEKESPIGREEQYLKVPMFSCSGESMYPTKLMGKSCYSMDMATNQADNCGLVAAVGGCDTNCVGGFCGVNEPPEPDLGTTNVLYVYMNDHERMEALGQEIRQEKEEEGSNAKSTVSLILATVLPVVAFASLVAFFLWKRLPNGSTHSYHKPSQDDKTVAVDGSQMGEEV